MFIERRGVIILHLDPPQSAYMEAAVSVQAVAAVHCWLILSPYPLLLHSKSGKSELPTVRQSSSETIKGDSSPRLSWTIIINHRPEYSRYPVSYEVLDFWVY